MTKNFLHFHTNTSKIKIKSNQNFFQVFQQKFLPLETKLAGKIFCQKMSNILGHLTKTLKVMTPIFITFLLNICQVWSQLMQFAKKMAFPYNLEQKELNYIQVSNMGRDKNLRETSMTSDGSNYVRSSIVRSQKQGVRVRLPIDEHVRVRSIFEKMTLSQFDEKFNKSSGGLLGSMFVCSKPKIECSSSITN